MDDAFKISVVHLIVKGDVEEALQQLSEYFDVKAPKIRVGTIKGHRKASAVYQQSNRTIYASSRESLLNPIIVLHEFYHHLQLELYGKKGNEKYANKFASDFVHIYKSIPKDQTINL